MIPKLAFGSIFARLLLKYFVRVLFPLPGFPSMYSRLEPSDADHA
jgi:hypothetical protein